MKQIQVTGKNRKQQLKKFLRYFYNDDLDKYPEERLIEMHDALGFEKITKHNFGIMYMRNEIVEESSMWTEEQAKDLDRRFEKHKNELKAELKAEIKVDIKAEVDLLRQEMNKKFDENNSKFDKLFKHLGIE